MDKRYSVLRFFSQVFMLYGIINIFLNLLCLLCGNSAEEFSTMFMLGSKGLAVATSFQFFGALTAVMSLKTVFMTDIFIRKMSLTMRIILMFVSVFILIVVFVILFGWFPVDQPAAWVMFIICTAVSCTISTIVSSAAEKQENQKLDEALRRIKEENQ